jgi:hypothetical protein
MKAKMRIHDARHASRGQAVIETAIALPLFLIGLFGVMWAFRTGMLSEQVQQSVRYGGLVSALADPYESYSLYTVYANIDNSPPPNSRDCAGGSTNVISQGHDTFWKAGATTSTAPSCSMVILFPGMTNVSSPVILFSDYVAASATSQFSGNFGALTYGNQTIAASQNFFRSPDVGALLDCSTLGAAVKKSLEAKNDTTTSATAVATPFPQTIPVTNADIIPTTVPNSCYTLVNNAYAAPTAPY